MDEELTVGKFKGKQFSDVAKEDSGYSSWVLNLKDPSDPLLKFQEYLKNAGSPSTPSTARPQLVEVSPNVNSKQPKRSLDDFAYVSPDTTGAAESKNDSYPLHELLSPPQNNVAITPPIRSTLNQKIAIHAVNPLQFQVVSFDRTGRDSTFLPRELYLKLLDLKADDIQQEGPRVQMYFSASRYAEVSKALLESFPGATVDGVPNFVLRSLSGFASFASAKKFPKFVSRCILPVCDDDPNQTAKVDAFFKSLNLKLQTSLRPFQIAGIKYGIQRGGRVLIGDEMGLGKTVQALVLAAFYRSDWPVLVICPSSVRFQWRDQAAHWLADVVSSDQCIVVRSGKAKIPVEALIVVTSYDLISRNSCFRTFPNEKGDPYKVVICDESHYIKEMKARRTQEITPLLAKARRSILLSGTPALNKPIELWPQLNAVMPGFANNNEFGERYCIKEKNVYSRKMEFKNAKHMRELNQFLIQTVMIRRLKNEVQKELPPKIRTRIPCEVDAKYVQQISELMQQTASTEDSAEDTEGQGTFRDPKIAMAYKVTSQAKEKPACDYLDYLLDTTDAKLIVFGHHISMLDALEEKCLAKTDNAFIRVDGKVAQKTREERITRFRQDRNCRVAILSITACGIGLNLTEADTVLFAELYWVPGVMIQAEDRAHRMGSTHSTVNIMLLIAEGTMDDKIWKLLERKYELITSALNGTTESINAVESDQCVNRKFAERNPPKREYTPADPNFDWKNRKNDDNRKRPSQNAVRDIRSFMTKKREAQKKPRIEDEDDFLDLFDDDDVIAADD